MPLSPKQKDLVLVVDDEAQNLAFMRQTLSGEFPLRFAKSGREALAAIHQFKPKLVLLDIQLPDIDGYEVCQRIKNDPMITDLPVIFVTSRAEITSENEGFDVGGADYIIKPIIPSLLIRRIKSQLSLVRAGRLEESYKDAIQMLSEAGHYNDTDTGLHIWRMAAYARALAEHLGLDQDSCDLIEKAAPLHDTGKIGIPDSILRKKGKLDPDEWEVMKTHSFMGYEILSKSKAPVFQLAADIAYSHHEKWDGSGYPRGLLGLEISLESRIVAIADVFDALTTKRPYKEPWGLDETFDYLEQNAGTQFDPELIDSFCNIRPTIERIRREYQDRN